MATIYSYKGDRYQAVIRRTGFKARTRVFDRKSDAEKWAREIEAEMDKRSYSDPTDALKMTVRELFQKAIDELIPLRKGARWDRTRIQRMIRDADFVHRRLDKLKPQDIQDWRDKRLKEVSVDSVNRELNTISGIFKHAIKEWHIGMPVNPVHMILRPTGGNRSRNRRWSDANIRKLLHAAGWSEEMTDKVLTGQDWGACAQPKCGKQIMPWLVVVALETAMRPSELAALQVKDFHPDELCLRLHDTKTAVPRDVPLSSKALKVVEFLVKDRLGREQLFFVGWETMGVYYRELRAKAGLSDDDLRMRDFRHEGTTRLSKKFSNVLELSAVTGHRNLQSLKRYYNPTAAELAARIG